MELFNKNIFNFLSKIIEDAVVFLDDTSSECVHWFDGFKKLLEAGALDVRDVKHSKECLESEARAVFIVSSPLLGQISKYIQRIVKSSDFSQCIIVSTISSEANNFIVKGHQSAVFDYYERQLKLWMQNELATIQIIYLPMFAFNLTSNVFITPPSRNLFPILPSDVARLQGFLHSKGDKKIFNHLGDVDINFLPHNIQSNIKILTSSLASMFEAMKINEDCYSVGHFSRLIANDLANMPDLKGRRKAATNRASIIFIDRTLDLVAPISHTSDSVLGTIYEILPRLKNHNNDVEVDMTNLFASGNSNNETLFPGSLAHYGNQEVQKLFTHFIRKPKKACLAYICKCLHKFLKEESIAINTSIESNTVKDLKILLDHFRNNQTVLKKYSGFLQCTMALVNTLCDEENEHLNELLSAEKGILLEMGQSETSPFSQVTNMLTNKTKQRFDVVDALMFCLFIYSAENDASNLSPGDEEKIKEVIINLLMDGSHKEDLLFLLGDLDSSERQIRTRIADIFERLRVISQARREMNKFKNVINQDTTGVVKYEALVKQIIERIFDGSKAELEDIEFRSHGIKDFLKTGFGFFMNVTKPRPDDHPLLFLYMVGGITWHEIKIIQETLEKTNPSTKVVIGSTRIITPSDIVEQVLCAENLFVDVET